MSLSIDDGYKGCNGSKVVADEKFLVSRDTLRQSSKPITT